MDRNKRKRNARLRRHASVRRKVHGTPERPRMCVFRSNKHISVQVIDDLAGRTLASSSSQGWEVRDSVPGGSSVAGAEKVGELIGRKCLAQGITAVVFDRSGYRYHGRVKALAEAARKQFKEAGAQGF